VLPGTPADVTATPTSATILSQRPRRRTWFQFRHGLL
jgi:hypothetical protein